MDFESDECTYDLTIVAYDGEDVASEVHASVHVVLQNLNDNPVEFINDTIRVILVENHVGQFTTIEVFDLDSVSASQCSTSSQSSMLGNITFTVFALNAEDGIFTIDSEGHLSATQPLDYESLEEEIELLVSVINGLFNSLATVIIELLDENEFCPEVAETTVSISIPETTEINTAIYQVSVTDDDGSDDGSSALFELVTTDNPPPFTVDQDGRILLDSTLDYEGNKTMYIFQVRVHDNSGNCDGVIVTIQVEVTNANDELPYFVEKEYTFFAMESLPPMSVVGEVRAYDPDLMASIPEGLLFSLGPGDSPFIVGSSGEIILIRTLDFESERTYKLEVTAFDGQYFSAPANLTVFVQNVNEHLPEFIGQTVFDLLENEIKSFPVNVTDRDAGSFGLIDHFMLEGTAAHLFSISNNGLLTNSHAMDYERPPGATTLQLNVCAFNTDDSSTCQQFTVNLIDVNDNAPHFSQQSYSAEITAVSYTHLTLPTIYSV